MFLYEIKLTNASKTARQERHFQAINKVYKYDLAWDRISVDNPRQTMRRSCMTDVFFEISNLKTDSKALYIVKKYLPFYPNEIERAKCSFDPFLSF